MSVCDRLSVCLSVCNFSSFYSLLLPFRANKDAYMGALNLQDRKMKDKEISGGGNNAGPEKDGQKCRAGMLSVIFQSCIFLSCKFSRPVYMSFLDI